MVLFKKYLKFNNNPPTTALFTKSFIQEYDSVSYGIKTYKQENVTVCCKNIQINNNINVLPRD